MKRLDPASSLLLVVDIQEKLARAMHEPAMTALSRAAAVLLEAADALGVPAIATEQYPEGLGPTLAPVKERLAARGAAILSKLEFSALLAPGMGAALAAHNPSSVIVIGMETHVCVFQTVRELCARGISVHVPIDGVASRREDHRDAGLALCREAGATITTAETVAFDWLGKAGGEAFKRVSKIVR